MNRKISVDAKAYLLARLGRGLLDAKDIHDVFAGIKEHVAQVKNEAFEEAALMAEGSEFKYKTHNFKLGPAIAEDIRAMKSPHGEKTEHIETEGERKGNEAYKDGDGFAMKVNCPFCSFLGSSHGSMVVHFGDNHYEQMKDCPKPHQWVPTLKGKS